MSRKRQLDLFDTEPPPTPIELREIARFGRLDAMTGLSLRNYYSSRITGERLATYERAFREERANGPTWQ